MDIEVLRKKVSTFKSKSGRVRITDDHLYMEILCSWEEWKGSTKDFYKSLGISKTGIAGIIGKAKRMRRDGHFPIETFKEVKIEPVSELSNCSEVISIKWGKGKIIRFGQVDQLIEFLIKVDKQVA